jgi:two-component system LytT family response regulator
MITPTIKAIIIEDEENSYLLLRKTLEEFCENVEVIAHAKSIKEGRKTLATTPCDIVFMDIEIKDGKSFEILEMLPENDFYLIFTTAYDHYAIKAIKYGALDYLLKPYSPTEVVNAVSKVRAKITEKTLLQQNTASQKEAKEENKLIKLKTKEGYEFVVKKDIVYFQADGSYSIIHFVDNSKITLTRYLKDIEKSEEFSGFERIHSSYLINRTHIRKYIKADGGWVQLSNGVELPISRRKKQEFLENLQNG